MKHRTVGLGGLLGILLAGTLATSALGVSFNFATIKDVCVTSGGAHGFGYTTLKVKVKEFGMSGANYFRILSKVQYRNNSGWHTLHNFGWEYSNTFPNNGDNYYHVLQRRFDPDGTPDALAHRIWMRAQVWSNNSGLLAEKVMKNNCPTGI
jgi:hypothetical protein